MVDWFLNSYLVIDTFTPPSLIKLTEDCLLRNVQLSRNAWRKLELLHIGGSTHHPCSIRCWCQGYITTFSASESS